MANKSETKGNQFSPMFFDSLTTVAGGRIKQLQKEIADIEAVIPPGANENAEEVKKYRKMIADRKREIATLQGTANSGITNASSYSGEYSGGKLPFIDIEGAKNYAKSIKDKAEAESLINASAQELIQKFGKDAIQISGNGYKVIKGADTPAGVFITEIQKKTGLFGLFGKTNLQSGIDRGNESARKAAGVKLDASSNTALEQEVRALNGSGLEFTEKAANLIAKLIKTMLIAESEGNQALADVNADRLDRVASKLKSADETLVSIYDAFGQLAALQPPIISAEDVGNIQRVISDRDLTLARNAALERLKSTVKAIPLGMEKLNSNATEEFAKQQGITKK